MDRFLYSFMLLLVCLPMANAQSIKRLTLTYDESVVNYSFDADTLKQKSYPFVADTMNICITKDNYIPVVYKYVKGGNLYIQNEIMQGNNHVRGDYIMVGSNVTTEKEEGLVTIEDGSTVIKSTNSVTIT